MAGSSGKRGTFPAGRANRLNKTLTRAQFRQMLDARREIKYITLSNEASAPADGLVFPLTQKIVVGDTADMRDGSQIQLTKFNVRCQFYLHPSAALDFVRYILFVDTQNNGVAPARADLLVSADPNSSYTRAVSITKRFHILKDMCIPLTSTGSSLAVVRDFTVTCRRTVTYSGTTDVESANSRNSVWFLVCGDQAANFSTYTLDHGIFFTDS